MAIGNADAHGKNLGFIHEPTGSIRLAPLYDTVPTALWPELPARAAMHINGRTELSAVALDDIVAEARTWRLDPRRAEEAAVSTVRELLTAVEAASDLPEPLTAYVTERCHRLLG